MPARVGSMCWGVAWPHCTALHHTSPLAATLYCNAMYRSALRWPGLPQVLYVDEDCPFDFLIKINVLCSWYIKVGATGWVGCARTCLRAPALGREGPRVGLAFACQRRLHWVLWGCAPGTLQWGLHCVAGAVTAGWQLLARMRLRVAVLRAWYLRACVLRLLAVLPPDHGLQPL